MSLLVMGMFVESAEYIKTMIRGLCIDKKSCLHMPRVVSVTRYELRCVRLLAEAVHMILRQGLTYDVTVCVSI